MWGMEASFIGAATEGPVTLCLVLCPGVHTHKNCSMGRKSKGLLLYCEYTFVKMQLWALN